LIPISETHNEQVEWLLIYSYDNRIKECQTDQSMENTKLVDLKVGSFHSTENYVDTLKHMINVHKEVKNYLKIWILVAPIDYPRQLHVRYAITHWINVSDSFEILEQILHIVLIIEPLYVSLNSHETVFLLNYRIFDKLFHEVFRYQKVLVKKPKPYKINLLLELTSQG